MDSTAVDDEADDILLLLLSLSFLMDKSFLQINQGKLFNSQKDSITKAMPADDQGQQNRDFPNATLDGREKRKRSVAHVLRMPKPCMHATSTAHGFASALSTGTRPRTVLALCLVTVLQQRCRKHDLHCRRRRRRNFSSTTTVQEKMVACFVRNCMYFLQGATSQSSMQQPSVVFRTGR